jgi:hypothetical protein
MDTQPQSMDTQPQSMDTRRLTIDETGPRTDKKEKSLRTQRIGIFVTMRRGILLSLSIVTAGILHAQELYQMPAGVTSRVSSMENLNGLKGKGGMANNGAKGSAFTNLKAGASITLLDVRQPGIIQRIWCTLSDRSPDMLRSLRLQMYWDGSAKAAVDVPFGDFFCAALQPVAFQSALFSDPEGRSFNCTIPMPYRSGARIVLTNESPKDLDLLFFDIDFLQKAQPDSSALYFHACWTRTNHAAVGTDAVILPEIHGRGRFLGVSIGLNVDSVYGRTWWGEGDDQYPSIAGTGSEDYIGTGWSEGQFAHLYQGCLVAGSAERKYAFYRFHVPDPIYFQSDCKVTIQQIGGGSRPEVLALQKNGVPLQFVSASGVAGFRGAFDDRSKSNIVKGDAKDWMNFYRSDDYAATAYFYLDRPDSELPGLAPEAERIQH